MASISRVQLHDLAEAKLADAQLLFANQRFSNAYYLFGYSVEIALKACVAKHFVADALPDKTLAQKIFTHRFPELVGLAGLTVHLDTTMKADGVFKSHWLAVNGWSEEARYASFDEIECKTMKYAILDPDHGVMRWLKQYW
ncbi:MAG: hypothetical protein P4L82_00460 [Ancalomicrobiaceae bacterium]|nr:hypothetical protein [Ancalomicrobiaceae bacterium]